MKIHLEFLVRLGHVGRNAQILFMRGFGGEAQQFGRRGIRRVRRKAGMGFA